MTGQDEGPRCAPWTAALGVDPIGSAVRVDRLVLVEVPLPWPADVGDHPWLARLDLGDGCRVQAVVPEATRPDGAVLVTRWERRAPTGACTVGAGLAGTDWHVPAAGLQDLLARVCAGDPADDAGPSPAPDEVLVCAHGSRDRCCGGDGTRVAVATAAALDDVRVRRTSHLGGHRFAPTAMTLPDGRYWAYVDADALAGIVGRTMRPDEARELYRGNAALDAAAQVVEGALLTEVGWRVAEATGFAAVVVPGDDGDRVTLRWDGPDGYGTREGTVRVERRYPVLPCGRPVSEATKDAVAWALAD